ncbi:MAG: metal-dependent hydrolase protein [Nitrospira sp.]|jgi:endonuclease/exonuclease/phosphatase family metal-dependent hydrolase|nr:metal-dependent hydrolase protein [Nitrospira sp.]
MRLHVASYNIHRGFGRDGHYEPGRILQVLLEMDADIVALQEVDVRGPDRVQILPWLAARTNMTEVAGPVRTSPEGEYGNALLTRLPVEKVRRWDLSVGAHEPRGVLDVDMNWNGRSIQVLNAHLGLWPLERTHQVQRLLELLDVTRRELTVLMGDLNEWCLGGKSLRSLQGVFGQPSAPKTFPARWPLLALDRIWIAPAQAQGKVHAHHTAMSLTASDHLPVMAEITLGDENRGERRRF